MREISLSVAAPYPYAQMFAAFDASSLIHVHKAPVPEPVEDPLPGEHPVPQEDPVPSPNPEIDDPKH